MNENVRRKEGKQEEIQTDRMQIKEQIENSRESYYLQQMR